MSHPTGVRVTRAPRPAATAAVLLVAAACALVAAWLLGSWVVDRTTSTRLWRVEDVVGLAVVAVGVLAAGWVGASALVAGVCAAARASGGAWRTGEAAVQRWAPLVVRRALAVTVAAGVGLGTAVGAHAAVEPPQAAVVVDLGWTPTASAPTSSATADTVPLGEAPDATSAATTPAGQEDAGQVPHEAATHDVATLADPSGDGTAAPAPATTGPTLAPPRAGDDDHADGGSAPDARTAPVVPLLDPSTGVSPVDLAVAPPPASTPTAGQEPAAGTVVVRPGDTLWGIAARALGPDASDARIAAEWPRWYAANTGTIGPDPDILLPGQVLVVPGPEGAAR